MIILEHGVLLGFLCTLSKESTKKNGELKGILTWEYTMKMRFCQGLMGEAGKGNQKKPKETKNWITCL